MKLACGKSTLTPYFLFLSSEVIYSHKEVSSFFQEPQEHRAGRCLWALSSPSSLLWDVPGWDFSISGGWNSREYAISLVHLLYGDFPNSEGVFRLVNMLPLCWAHCQIYLWISQVFEALKYFMTAVMFIWGHGITQDSGSSVSGSPVCPYENFICFLGQFSPVCSFSA